MSKPGYNIEKLTGDIATKSALEALRAFKKEEREKKKKQQLHNVGKLMENYLDLIEHLEKIKYKTDDELEYLSNMDIDVDELEEVSIQSIMRSKVRTVIMVTQIETAMGILKHKMEQRGEYEKYQAMKMIYMDPDKKGIKFNQRITQIAKSVSCGESTLRRWNNEMLNELSKYIFGIDGLRLDV